MAERSTTAPAADPAGRAFDTFGLAGDPTASWSILLRARTAESLDPAVVAARLASATRMHPHLGPPPEISDIDLTAMARPYRRREPLVRIGLTGTELSIAAHHGVVDGLGLIALLGIALDVPVSSSARGVPESRSAATSFIRSAITRGGEAVFAPPGRVAADPGQDADAPDRFAERHLPARKLDTATLTSGAARAIRSWNAARSAGTSRVVAAVGASHRSGTTPLPVHDSTFFRLRLSPDVGVADVRRLLAAQPPEPDFPPSSSRLARLCTRLLANRLGSTFLVSNLGRVDAHGAVLSLAFHPTASGPSGVAFGAATVGGTTTVTVRAKGAAFTPEAANALLAELGHAIEDPAVDIG